MSGSIALEQEKASWLISTWNPENIDADTEDVLEEFVGFNASLLEEEILDVELRSTFIETIASAAILDGLKTINDQKLLLDALDGLKVFVGTLSIPKEKAKICSLILNVFKRSNEIKKRGEANKIWRKALISVKNVEFEEAAAERKFIKLVCPEFRCDKVRPTMEQTEKDDCSFGSDSKG